MVPGSHLIRDPKIDGATDEDLLAGWMKARVHPIGGRPLTIEAPEAETGSVALLWTHAAHAVNPRQKDRDTRWCVVYGYQPLGAVWLSTSQGGLKSPTQTPEFENHYEGAEGLLWY